MTVKRSVGQVLSDAGHPGEWSQIDIDDLMDKIPGRPEYRSEFAQTLRDMLIWLAEIDWLETKLVQRYCARLERYIGPPGVDSAA